MYSTILNLHSYLAYIVFVVLIIAIANAIMGFVTNRDFVLGKDFRISLFALILSHIQLVVGLVLFFVSPLGLNAITEFGMGGLNSAARLLAVEHPFVNILAIVAITIGWSKHKKEASDKRKFGKIALFYGIGFLLLLSRIPWNQWF